MLGKIHELLVQMRHRTDDLPSKFRLRRSGVKTARKKKSKTEYVIAIYFLFKQLSSRVCNQYFICLYIIVFSLLVDKNDPVQLRTSRLAIYTCPGGPSTGSDAPQDWKWILPSSRAKSQVKVLHIYILHWTIFPVESFGFFAIYLLLRYFKARAPKRFIILT